MATPENTLITRAEVTSITDATTGRKALVLDGTTIEMGNTGVRDLSGMFVAGKVASGRVLVQRIGNIVTWTLVSLNLTGPVATIHNVLPAAGNLTRFHPPYTATEALMQSEAEYARLVVGAAGSIDIHFGIPGVNYTGTVSYMTNASWPTTLPGVADGQPVAV